MTAPRAILLSVTCILLGLGGRRDAKAGAPAPDNAAIEVKISADRISAVPYEPFQILITVSGAHTDITAPAIPPISHTRITPAGREQNVHFINGKVVSSLSFRYTVVPTVPGTLTIPAVRMSIDGRTHMTQPLNITVVASRQGQDGTETHPEVFVRSATDKTRLHVGEQVIYSFKMYYRVQLLSQPDFAPPPFTGFLTEPLQSRQYQATHQGVSYRVSEARYALFPASPGTRKIGSGTLRIQIANPGGKGPFSNFFRTGRPLALSSEPITLNVIPLPEQGRPAGFGGVVGSYSIKATLDRDRVEAGKPVTLNVEVSGAGQVKSLQEPAWPELPGVKRYETVTELNVNTKGDMVSGSKSFKTVLIPQTSGRITIPSISYPVFDPARSGSGGYRILKTPAMPLTVLRGAVPVTARGSGKEGHGEVRTLERDIRFVKSTLDSSPAQAPVHFRRGFWGFQLLPLAFLLSGFAVSRIRARARRNPAGVRARSALKAARERLKAAEKELKRDREPVKALVAVQETLANYLADLWNVSAAGLTLAQIEARLKASGAGDEIAGRVRTLWERADLVRYTPAAGAGENESPLKEARRLLDELERGR